jgi:hypothetical protein
LKSKLQLLAVGLGILVVAAIIYYYYNETTTKLQQKQNEIVQVSGIDKFGIKEVYPTQEGGREWYLNTDDPLNDNIFSITSNVPITKNLDDNGQSWSINNSEVRMNVDTPPSTALWKNVEITGYVKVKSIINGSEGDDESIGRSGEPLTPSLDWRARGGIHSSKSPCEGTALDGEINIVDRTASWKKEIWHTGGYTDSRDQVKVSDKPLTEKWIGWKTVMYNMDNDTAVKMESYIDEDNNNQWKKVNDLTDSGGWFANSSDEVFSSANCGKPKDYIITNGGSIVTFRSDNILFDFKNLSVREIQPPPSSSSA